HPGDSALEPADAQPRIGEQRTYRVVAVDQPRRATVPDPHPAELLGIVEFQYIWRRGERATRCPSHRKLGDVRVSGGRDVGHRAAPLISGGWAPAALTCTGAHHSPTIASISPSPATGQLER